MHSQLYEDKQASGCLTISEIDVLWRGKYAVVAICYIVHIAAVSTAAVVLIIH